MSLDVYQVALVTSDFLYRNPKFHDNSDFPVFQVGYESWLIN